MRRLVVCSLLIGYWATGCGRRNGPIQEPGIIDLLQLVAEHKQVGKESPDFQTMLYTFVRDGQKHQTITLQANSKVPLPRLVMPAHATLTFALTMPFNLGDGAVARVYFRCGKNDDLLFEHLLDPARRREDRSWQEVSIDLSAYAGRSGEIVLQASGETGELTGDWICWGDPKIRIR
jgi:hypothetical protein